MITNAVFPRNESRDILPSISSTTTWNQLTEKLIEKLDLEEDPVRKITNNHSTTMEEALAADYKIQIRKLKTGSICS